MRSEIVVFTSIILLTVKVVDAGPLHDAIKGDEQTTARNLIYDGADIDEVDFFSGSPLHIASVRGNIDVVELLIAAGADANSQEFQKGDTPLHWAALAGHTLIIERLVRAGADVDALNDYQNTPLHIAASVGHAEAAKRLIELDANLTARNQWGRTAMHLAGRKEMFDVVELLKAKGAQQPPPSSIEPLMTLANPTRGEEIFKARCAFCHVRPDAQVNDTGPTLWDVVGRPQATLLDFNFSAAFNRLDGIWDYENLNLLLVDSWNFFPGTAMGLAVPTMISEPQDRADIISYLRLQSNKPVPLP